jgi:uncharacterized RDD family membrane protein YckC
MGAYAPTPLCSKEMLKKIDNELIIPTLKALKKEKTPYNGVLFAGIMVVNHKPYLLEYNVRFGDPECEVLLPLLDTPFGEIVTKTCNNELVNLNLKIKNLFCVGVVLASENYPFKSSPKQKITLNQDYKKAKNSIISYGGVSSKNNIIYADGGRICVSIGYDKNLEKAKKNAYKLCDSINFKGKKYRNDISNKAFFDENLDTNTDVNLNTHSNDSNNQSNSNINIQENLAPLKLRYTAFFIDEFIVSVLIIILMWKDINATGFEPIALTEVMTSYVYIIISIKIIYQTFFVWYYGATLGKMFAKIRVVSLFKDKDGNEDMKRVSLSTAIIRSLVRYIGESFLFYISFIVANFTNQRKTLHDYISKTVVVEIH